MRTVQRVYVYVMAFASLVGITVGVINVSRVVVAPLVGFYFVAEDFARWAGLLVVAFPLHVLHAWWAWRRGRMDAEERASGIRKLYVYGVALMGLVLWLVSGARTMTTWVQMCVQGWNAPLSQWLLQVGSGGLNVAWTMLLMMYAWVWARADGDVLAEVGWGRLWRRLFALTAGIAGLVVMTSGVVQWGQVVLVRLFVPFQGEVYRLGVWWKKPLSEGIALMVVGSAVWYWAWSTWQRWGDVSEDERFSWPRQVFYYSGIGLGLGMFLVGVGYVLRLGLFGLLGVPWGDPWRWGSRTAWALMVMGVGAGVWWVYRRYVERERLGLEKWEALLVERVYMYVVSGVALGVTWWGSVRFLQALTMVLWGGGSFSDMQWRRFMATGLALVLVAGPVWIRYWKHIQQVARRRDDVGHLERRSLLRRGYVYGVSLIAGIILLIYLAQVAYYGVLWFLGVELARWEEFSYVLGPGFVALWVWVYHMWVIRQDARLERTAGVVSRKSQLLREREILLKRLQEIDEELRQLEGEGAG